MAALHDFARNDYRLFGQLLVRLDFVKTWSAARTLRYYRVIRNKVDFLREDMYDYGWMRQENGGVKHEVWLKAPYNSDEFKQSVVDFGELERYKNALKWVLDHMERVPCEKKRKSHPDSYYVR